MNLAMMAVAALSIMHSQASLSSTWRFEDHQWRRYVAGDSDRYISYIDEAERNFRSDPPFLPPLEGETLDHRAFVDCSTGLVVIEIFFSVNDVSAIYIFDQNGTLVRRYLRSAWRG